MDLMLNPHCFLTVRGRAISATFAEDGMESENCHLCFTALSWKTRVCMCACMRVGMHQGERGDHNTAPVSQQVVGVPHPNKVCVCLQGGGAGCSDWNIAFDLRQSSI